MEAMMKGPLLVKEERRIESIDHHEEDEETRKLGSEELTIPDTDSLQSSSPNRKESCFIKEEDHLKSTKAEMGEVREENERLKMILSRIVKDYQALQVKFFDALQQEPAKKKTECTPSIPHDVEERDQLVSLSLGTSLSGQKEEKKNTSKPIEEYGMEKGLALGLDCKYESSSSGRNEPTLNLSPENSFEEPKDEETGEPLPPSKIPKNPRTGDDEVSQQIQVKKARVSVRARCDAPTMHDGCQWRKYGQKIAKGNPCPRAYYRCTIAPACPVRKQVQRCAEDMSILITTYEGTHNHPLPISATAMASATSAAATILMSGASPPSLPAIGCPSSSSTTPTNLNLHSFNFGGSLQNTGASQLYLPNPRISSSLSHPTITLDLTTPPTSSTSQPSQLYNNRFSSSFTSNPKYPSSSLDFSSLESSINPIPWSNGYLAYGPQSPYNSTHIGSFINLNGRQSSQDHLCLKSTNSTNSSTTPAQNPLTDTIAKAISSDPSFQSALISAIKSYVGSQGGGDQGLNYCLKWGEKFNSVTSTNGCASSYLTRSTAPSNSNPEQGNLMLLQPSMPYSTSKSASASPVDNNESIN